MQQLSSRDCDKWLSMTLTMKESVFFHPHGEEKGAKGEKVVGDERRERNGKRFLSLLWRPSCAGAEVDTLKPRARFC